MNSVEPGTSVIIESTKITDRILHKFSGTSTDRLFSEMHINECLCYFWFISIVPYCIKVDYNAHNPWMPKNFDFYK